MAEKQRKTSRKKASGKTGVATSEGPLEEAVREAAPDEDGAERLRQAADRRVGMNSEKLVDLLTQKALDGDLASTRVLVGLAEGKKPRAKPAKKRRGVSLAGQLEAEPEWKAPAEKQGTGNREQGTGNRE
jgi:hypothetical protein